MSSQLAWRWELRLILDLGAKALEQIRFYKGSLEYFKTLIDKDHTIFLLTMNYCYFSVNYELSLKKKQNKNKKKSVTT